MVERIKNSMDLKKIIKVATILFGFSLIVFVSFYNATFDFENFNWGEWLANSSILVGIMIFGILMGNSTGVDIQKEKIGGRFQNACNDYNDIIVSISTIKMFFSQFWLMYKERKLEEKKVEYLVDNQFENIVAQKIVKNIKREDLKDLTLVENDTKPIYVKNGIKFEKLTNEQIEIIRKIYDIKLDTFGVSYYLSLFDEGIETTNEAEKGKKIAEKIRRDKAFSYALKIISSLIISIVWSALTINDFVSGGGDDAKKRAWMNLLSRISALITSYVSGFSTSVVNVRDQASAIENKTSILKEFKICYDNKTFIPETYEQMIERKYREQEKLLEENSNIVDNNNGQQQL